MTSLTVVLISKDQEWNIGRLVESVLKETGQFPDREIVLVDSASSDQTTEIAARYPISVLKLYSEQRLTAAAGRYVGYHHTTGDLVLFLDGDMELCSGWLEQATQVLGSQSDAAVVTGVVIDRPISMQTPFESTAVALPGNYGEIIQVRHGGGAAMYRRSVLSQVGTFNPYLYSDEEPELCLRIRNAGYRVLRLPHPIAYHYSAPLKAFSTLINKRKNKFFLGFGQNIRYFLGSPLFWRYLRERGWAVAPGLLLILGVLAVVLSGLTGAWVWLALWGAGVIAITLVLAIQKRSLKRALLTLFGKLLILEGTLRGFLLRPDDPSEYPERFEVVQQIFP